MNQSDLEPKSKYKIQKSMLFPKLQNKLFKFQTLYKEVLFIRDKPVIKLWNKLRVAKFSWIHCLLSME